MGAWRKVKKETIVNCFSRCGFNEANLELFIEDDADAEFAGLQSYISEISPDSTVDSYLNQDKDAVISFSTFDIPSINWKDEMREKANCCVLQDDNETEKQAEAELKNKEKQAQIKLLYLW